MTEQYVRWLESLDSQDVPLVGGKNASLGEMMQHLRGMGVRVPEGFATTAHAYWDFVEANHLKETIAQQLKELKHDEQKLAQAAKAIRESFYQAEFPPSIAQAIQHAYGKLAEKTGHHGPSVAVRSSATAEDLPDASFAGQQETFLNIRGEESLLDACRRCFASLFTDRAIMYRENHGFDHMKVALSIGVQRMVRSDQAGAGVMFSIDTESGFPHGVLIDAAWGLGESVVQGLVDPDEYMVFKPLLENPSYCPIIAKKIGNKAQKIVYATDTEAPIKTIPVPDEERFCAVLQDKEILTLARWAVAIEEHYGHPMDMEWAKDGITHELFIVQARPETVESRKEPSLFKTYTLKHKGKRLLSGLSIGGAIGIGKVCKLQSTAEIDRFEDNAVLVTQMTDPDWVPIMKRAAAIVTDHGGRTSHAAIVSRELGLPAVVGTGKGTEILQENQEITVSCAEGEEGFIYEGSADYETQDLSLEDIPPTRTQIMLNVADPAGALRWWRLPSDGVGLARMELIINNFIKIHPMALVHWHELEDQEARQKINQLTAAWEDKPQYFVDTLSYGIARIAASQYPKPVIVRLSDFKTNEYAELIGGRAFEPKELNPMLGWRGASRYYSRDYREGFALECCAIRKVREEIGLDNIILMIPFCRTPAEADKVLAALAENGLTRGEKGLEVYVMCEIPANVILAHQFAERFDGFSIGSNDLTQLVLGIDRDSARLAGLFNEQDEAVREMITMVIDRAHQVQRKVGLCGQAPSDYPAFARFLVQSQIDSISVNPDSFINVKRQIAAAEKELTDK